jgi:glycerol-3-phosphate dehydrogenase (NAD(P)+)
LSDLAIIGAGSWGSALSIALAPRFETVSLWAFDPGLADQIRSTRENPIYLPGFSIPGNVSPTDHLGDAIGDAPIVLVVVPSHFLRGVVRDLMPLLTGNAVLVSATKGLEKGTLLRMSEVIEQEAAPYFAARVAVLSGPTFAREIAAGYPAAVVISSTEAQLAREVQAAFSGPAFRLYTNSDPAGVEIGAALKNVIAIGAGICQGLGLGHNTLAALVTRGLAEISRLAVALGGQPMTLAGLAGLGDLVLTCTGDLEPEQARRLGTRAGRKTRGDRRFDQDGRRRGRYDVRGGRTRSESQCRDADYGADARRARAREAAARCHPRSYGSHAQGRITYLIATPSASRDISYRTAITVGAYGKGPWMVKL